MYILKVLTAHENALYNRYSKKEQHRCLCCQRTILLEINNAETHLTFNLG